MSALVSTPVLFNLTNLQAPASGVTHALNLSVTSSAGTPAAFSPANVLDIIGAFQAQAMRVDNSENAVGITISESIFGWKQYVAAGETCTFNFPAIQSPEFSFVADAGTSTVSVQLFDFPAFAFVNQNPNNAAGLPVAAPSGAPLPVTIEGGNVGGATTYQDASVASTGASQTLVAANASRKYLTVGASVSAPVWINLAGGPAGPNLTGCLQIAAGGFYESNIWVPSNEVNIYCATAGLVIPCVEG